MGFHKYASFEVLSAVQIGGRGRTAQEVGFRRSAHRHAFEYDPKPGFLYVRSRAISSRCNDNFDEFPADEIKQAYGTFVGKPVFVNHVNDNHRRARGVIIDAALHEDTNPDGSPDTWCEVLMEVDAVKFPKLAEAILNRWIERTSMGTDVEFSICSFCGNRASTPLEYCAHIPKLKGKRIYRTTAAGTKEGVLVREICHGLKFFENSLLVEEPADPTAYFLGVDTRGLTGHLAKSATLITEAIEIEGVKIGGVDHKLEWLARGTKAAGRCVCGNWADLGTYVFESKRVQHIKDEFAKHLVISQDLADNPYEAAANKYKGSDAGPVKLRKPIRVRTNQTVSTTNWSAGPLDDNGISTRVPTGGAGRPIPNGWTPTDGSIPAGTEGTVRVWFPWTATYAVEIGSSMVQLGEDQLDFIDPKPGDKGRQPPHDPTKFQPRATLARSASLIKLAWEDEDNGEWDESEHPRGQPKNRGQFSRKPGLVAPGNPDADSEPSGEGKSKGKGKGMGLTKDDPIRTNDVAEAVEALEAGRFVQLTHVRQVSTLLDKLAAKVKEAAVAGQQAAPIDLCLVTVENTNLFCTESVRGARITMPQLMGKPLPGSKADALPKDARGNVDIQEQFRHSLIAGGFKVERTEEKASFLKASQNELNGVKVAGIMGAMERGEMTTEGAPVFTSNDNYIVDGHHRWAALVARDLEDGVAGDIDMDIERVDMDIITLLQAADEFAAEWGVPRAGFGNNPDAKTGQDPDSQQVPVAAGLRMSAALLSEALELDSPVCVGTGQSPVNEACPVCKLPIRIEDGKVVSHARLLNPGGSAGSDWLSGWNALKTAGIKTHVRAPQLSRSFNNNLRVTHLQCALDVWFTDNGWEAKLSTPGSYFTFDESGTIEKSKYNRKGDGAARSDFNKQWRDHLCQTFVWTAIKYSTSPPWPEPEDVEIDWTHPGAYGKTAGFWDWGTSTPTQARPLEATWRPVMRRDDAQRWAGRSKFAGPWYHGASAEGSQALLSKGFSAGGRSVADKYGPGIYLTKNRSEAARYGHGVVEVWVKPSRIGYTANYATANPQDLVRQDLRLPDIPDFNKAVMASPYDAISIGESWLEVLDPNDVVVVNEKVDSRLSSIALLINQAMDEERSEMKIAMQTRAAGEQVAPPEVDTLREETCPVCGETDTYDGDRCQVCNFVKPPDEFMDPDLDEAKRNDLRQGDDDVAPVEDKNLSCDNCGANFKGAPADGNQAEPEPTAPVVPEKTPVEVVDDQKRDLDAKDVLRDRNTLPKPKKEDEQDEDETSGPPQGDAKVDAEEPETAPKAGDTCPDCGKGKLQEAAPKPTDGPDVEDQVEEEDADDESDEDEDDDENPFAKKKKDGDDAAASAPDKKKKKSGFPPKKTQKEQSMRPALAALVEQQKVIEGQDRRIAALEDGLTFVATLAGVEGHPKIAALLVTADEDNPAQPIADVGAEAPTETTEQALQPEAKDDVTTPGPTPLTDVSPGATTDVTTPVDSSGPTTNTSQPKDSTPAAGDLAPIARRVQAEGPVLEEPLELNEVDVTAPVAGTEGPRPLNEVKIETEQRMGTPTTEVAFPLEGGPFAERATTGARTIAGLRLARLRMQAGIVAVTDDLTLGEEIAASAASDTDIQNEINTLSAVLAAKPKVTANRRLVPRQAGIAPSFQEPVIPVQEVVSAVDDSEFLFD